MMRKNLVFGMIATIIVSSAVIYGISKADTQQTSGMSDVTMANVEALADESGGGKKCYNTITTHENSKVLFCGTCTYITNSTDTSLSGTGTCP